jgi:hypothetical protein
MDISIRVSSPNIRGPKRSPNFVPDFVSGKFSKYLGFFRNHNKIFENGPKIGRDFSRKSDKVTYVQYDDSWIECVTAWRLIRPTTYACEFGHSFIENW